MTVAEILARSRWGLEALLDWQENQTIAAEITTRSVETTMIPGLGFHFLHGLLAGLREDLGRLISQPSNIPRPMMRNWLSTS